MKKARLPLILFFLLMTVHAIPQDQTRVDSLNRLLRKTKIDTLKVELLNQLIEEYINADTALARNFTEQSFRLSKRSGYTRGIAAHYMNLANLDIADGNYLQAWNAFIGAFLLMIIIAALILRSYRQKQKANIALQEKNIYISQQKEEIEAQKDEIEQQKEELQITLDHLKDTQEQLIQSEKLAALGGLVAGVAHEINTPVGISVTAASSLAEETSRMAAQYVSDKISRAAFKDYLNTANQSAKLILANMERTATMVQSFKQVSVDQSTEQKRTFKLKEYLEDVIRSLYPKLKGKKVKINLDIDYRLELNGYPGALSQIFTNLVLNSLVHGFENKDRGNINISAKQEDENLLFEYIDDGRGISKQNLDKIFDPFFTTNRKGGTGLGLHIVYNIVNQKLNGSISCTSEKEKGVSFRMKIPIL